MMFNHLFVERNTNIGIRGRRWKTLQYWCQVCGVLLAIWARLSFGIKKKSPKCVRCLGFIQGMMRCKNAVPRSSVVRKCPLMFFISYVTRTHGDAIWSLKYDKLIFI